ncbi:MAG TPA: glycosyltransferase [Longimicrobiales bacterium]
MAEELRVLFVSSVSDTRGGAERSLLELARALPGAGVRPSLAVWSEGELAAAFRAEGLDVHALRTRGGDPRSPLGGRTVGVPFIGSAARLAAWLHVALQPLGSERRWLDDVVASVRPHVIHTNCDVAPVVVSGARRDGVRWIAHVRDRVRAWTHPRVARALREADGVVASSRHLADWLAGHGIRATVVANPVDAPRLSRVVDAGERARIRREFRIPDGDLAVAVIGRLDAQKGAHLLPEIVRRVPASSFLFAGHAPPPMRARLDAAFRSDGVTQRVRLLGYRSDVAEWLPAMDVLLLPSAREAFGRVVVEGMLAGLAVVAPDDGGAAELVRHEVTGWLARSDSADGFVDVLQRLRVDAAARSRVGAAARAEAREHFAPAAIAARMRRVYESLPC